MKPKDTSEKQANLVEKFVVKRARYECIHVGKVRRNENRQGIRVNTKTKKIGCPCHFRLNFDEKRELFEITQFDQGVNKNDFSME